MLAAKNFKRNRKRYRSTVVGLFLSVTLFISASSFCAYLTDAVDQLGGDSTLGVQLYYSEALPEGVTPLLAMLYIAAGEFAAVSVIGTVLLKLLWRNRTIRELIKGL